MSKLIGYYSWSFWGIAIMFISGPQPMIAQNGCNMNQISPPADLNQDDETDADNLNDSQGGSSETTDTTETKDQDNEQDNEVEQQGFDLWQCFCYGPDDPPDSRCPNEPWYEGYGANTEGGKNGEIYHVTSLNDSGPGTLRDAVVNRDPDLDPPRIVVFDVAGTITLQKDIIVRVPYLTIDGATARAPGITIRKAGIRNGEFIIAGTHNIIIRHLRFHGLWEPGGEHANNTSTIVIDGDSKPDYHARNIVLDHITTRNGTDSSPDIWGEVSDVTVSWCLFFYNYHPTTVSHYPAPYQIRQRISMHHNVYAKNGERQPQLRADIRDFDYVNNIIYDWGYYGNNSGYGIRVRNKPREPQVNANIISNVFLPTVRPSWALVYGTRPGRDFDDGGPLVSPSQGTLVTSSSMADLYVYGNILPPENRDHYSTVNNPIPVPEYAQVTTFNAQQLVNKISPYVGMLYRTDEEQAILDEIKAKISQ